MEYIYLGYCMDFLFLKHLEKGPNGIDGMTSVATERRYG